MIRHSLFLKQAVVIFAVLGFPAAEIYAFDLFKVQTEKLENGLTVMVLEDHTQPLVSTQVLYKVGGRNECTGSTGLAHFVEHMAFRSTSQFPDTQDAIYGVGGEWHGYTWIDQTTYFETVPKHHLDVVLRLQADRMRNVVNRKEEVEAERGAVLTELHSYENDPGSVLYDQVVATSFMQHPYRFNVIGWTSDVEKISHADLVTFYNRFYQPSNAVLAIAGDVGATEMFAKARQYFGPLTSTAVESRPRTVEPVQVGEKRVQVTGTGAMHYFQITYRAPAATDHDFPAFLLLQAILGGNGGVNFRQSGFSEDVRPNTRLFGAAAKITTFFTATADPYIFNIAGRVPVSVQPREIEEAIEKRVSMLREEEISSAELESVRRAAQSELIFDLETTEDAAHQMAYFEGIGAFAVLQKLPDLIATATQKDIKRVAQKYLSPEKRTIGWYLASDGQKSQSLSTRSQMGARKGTPLAAGSPSLKLPKISRLKNGITLISQNVKRTPAGFIRVLLPTNTVEPDEIHTVDDPVWRHTSVHRRFLKEELEQAVLGLSKIFPGTIRKKIIDPALQDDPEFRVAATLKEMLGIRENTGNSDPVAIIAVGDIEESQVKRVVERSFSNLKSGRANSVPLKRGNQKQRVVKIPGKAQSQFGYALPAPAPASLQSYPYRLLLYILTHGYAGRLGKELIGQKGLIYYISSHYYSDGKNSWISISHGVNPDKLQTTKTEFERIMQSLRTVPPTQQELEEAKEHLIGRRITAYQSNEEISAFLAKEWIEQGRIMDQTEFERNVRSVKLSQVHDVIPAFLDGVTAVIDTN